MGEFFQKPSKLRSTLSRCIARCALWIPAKTLAKFVYWLVYSLSRERSPRDSLVFLLELERRLFFLTESEACRYGNGLHTKHRHTRYHDFFTQRLRAGENVLDVGCGNAALSYDMARTGARVVGVDIDKEKIRFAREHYSHPCLDLIHGDVFQNLSGKRFDTIVMSNVLEHLSERPEFLRKLQETFTPRRWLFRVPMYERDWRVPLMDELGVDSRLDDTHYIEYTKEQFVDELRQAGLRIVHEEIRWGEIWCEAVPKK